ncbi:glutamate decarboxylase [Xylariaceae sp. FL0016]|nr:glutamate decarboxylase [Xylariaceae sp. FL0016]
MAASHNTHLNVNGDAKKPLSRAAEVDDLIEAVKSLIIPYVRDADSAASSRASGDITPGIDKARRNVLVDSHSPEKLLERMKSSLPDGEAKGKDGLLATIRDVLQYSVNTWDQGFLDKLYSSTNAVHVYSTSPALTVIEKTTAHDLAALFGFTGLHAGGVTCQGGSGSNLTSLVVARNALYPATKTDGNGTYRFALFTSAHGHYSVEKAATACGMGSGAVIAVPVDASGRMIPSALRDAVQDAKSRGMTPLYVNATAGTTVFGSFDPFTELSAVCRDLNLWLHIDASWGGPAVFSAAHRRKLAGAHLADSITINPHKMLNVPLTCSFLLTPDVRVLHRANTLPAGYLFHGAAADGEVWDLADLTLQCGRRGDALKLALAWVYYGTAGFAAQIDGAFAEAEYLSSLVQEHADFVLVSENPPPCLQVCFYYAPGGKLSEDKGENTQRTKEIARRLVDRGFMIDYAPGTRGSFLRVVVNCQTRRETVTGLFKAVQEVAKEVTEA